MEEIMDETMEIANEISEPMVEVVDVARTDWGKVGLISLGVAAGTIAVAGVVRKFVVPFVADKIETAKANHEERKQEKKAEKDLKKQQKYHVIDQTNEK